jgi:hypothetical protein
MIACINPGSFSKLYYAIIYPLGLASASDGRRVLVLDGTRAAAGGLDGLDDAL